MSEHGFHVHGPHDHALEHESQAEPHGMAGRLAVATAIIATVGALFAYMAGLTQSNAGLYKNDAAIKKTEASNQWNYYQGKSSKQNLAELAAELAPEARKPFYGDEIKRYKGEKEDIKKTAEKFEHESDEFNAKSDERDDGAADLDRHGGDRPVDAEPTPAVRRLRPGDARRDRRRPGLAAHLARAGRAQRDEGSFSSSRRSSAMSICLRVIAERMPAIRSRYFWKSNSSMCRSGSPPLNSFSSTERRPSSLFSLLSRARRALLARVRSAAESTGEVVSTAAGGAAGAGGADAASADWITVTAAFSTFLQWRFSASLAEIVLL
jgi:hypothetical protein